MAQYKFKEASHKHYRGDGPVGHNGQPFTPTDAELKAFGDLLVPVSAPQTTAVEAPEATDVEVDGVDLDFDSLTIGDVLAAIGAGKITPAQALELEKDGKARVRLITELEAMIE